MERVTEFISEYMPQLIGVGIGYGSLLSLTAILLGYAISKALSLVDDK